MNYAELLGVVDDIRVDICGKPLLVEVVHIGERVYALRVYANLPDVKTGSRAWQYGRMWLLDYDTTKDAVIKTAYLAVKQFVEHELAEGFTVGGVRVFDPHREIQT